MQHVLSFVPTHRLERRSIDFDRSRSRTLPSSLHGYACATEPANRQAWLDCGVNVCCGIGTSNVFETLADAIGYVLEAGRNAATCPGSHRHYFAEAGNVKAIEVH